MAIYTRFDIEHWPRREHYRYYTEKLKIEYNLTVDIRVEKLLDYCHRNDLRFYPALISVITKTVNETENFRMFRDDIGQLCVWDHVVPNYTIFHDDDKTFSDCWSEYADSFDEQYRNITADMDRYQNVKGIKTRPDQPANYYCVSVEPWISFTGYNARVTNGEPQFCPIITGGRYRRVHDQAVMPVNLMIAHAVCDGYHASMFFKQLQEEIDRIGSKKESITENISIIQHSVEN